MHTIRWSPVVIPVTIDSCFIYSHVFSREVAISLSSVNQMHAFMPLSISILIDLWNSGQIVTQYENLRWLLQAKLFSGKKSKQNNLKAWIILRLPKCQIEIFISRLCLLSPMVVCFTPNSCLIKAGHGAQGGMDTVAEQHKPAHRHR